MDNGTIETIRYTNEYDIIFIVLQGFKMYYIPILVYMGSLGNCLSVWVFFEKKMRRTSSNFYLAALAISDTGFLVSLFVVWLGVIEVNLFNRHGFCQFSVYFATVCSFLSSWFVVAFTVERFVVVRYPLRRQWMCTVTRAKTILLSITLIGLMVCGPVLFFPKSQTTNSFLNSTECTLDEEWLMWANVHNILDTVLTFVLPFFLIVILNGLIVKSFWQQRDTERPSFSQISQRVMHHTKVTKMLLIISSVFLCFNLPAYVTRIYTYILFQKNEEPHINVVIFQQLSSLLFNTSFGINFILYCATGQNFRTIVVRILCHRCQRQNNQTLSSKQVSNQRNLYVLEPDRSSRFMYRQRITNIKKDWTDSHEMQPPE